jgi:hypothetical protein
MNPINLQPSDLKSLAAVCQAALDYRILAFDAEFGQGGTVKKLFCSGNHRTFARILVSESFGMGQEWGQLDAMAFHHILANGDRASIWRVQFIHKTMADFKRNGWMVTDSTGRFRLMPDRWPNWPDVRARMKARDHSRLDFMPDDDLNAMLAKISQGNTMEKGQRDFISGETFAATGKRQISVGETFAGEPDRPPPKVEETHGIPDVSHVPMPSMSMPKTMPATRNLHVHDSCNSEGIKRIHEHEVGELGFRTTEQILADIRKLAPNLSAEFIEHWRARIEREDAALVNACVRQGFLQRRHIRNMGAWLNSCYLKAIRKQELEIKNTKLTDQRGGEM